LNETERRPERGKRACDTPSDLGLPPEVQVRVKRRNPFRAAEESGEDVNSYAMFTLGIAAFAAGSWAIVCLSKAIIDEGPLSLLRLLGEALMGK
jgi:hypothetical protein